MVMKSVSLAFGHAVILYRQARSYGAGFLRGLYPDRFCEP
jgi:hypothetical protein